MSELEKERAVAAEIASLKARIARLHKERCNLPRTRRGHHGRLQLGLQMDVLRHRLHKLAPLDYPPVSKTILSNP